MSQSRAMSAVEAVANVAVGFGLAMVVQTVVFPLFGFDAGPSEHLAIAAIFTGVSLVRSYALRRCFEALRRK